MSVRIYIIDGAIETDTGLPSSQEPSVDASCGAVVTFDGVVRSLEEGKRLSTLDYEAYEPMASRQLQAIATDIVRKHGLIDLICWHSRGRVGVGECSMRVVVRSSHRAAALAGMGEFIDRLKVDVPIWKRAVWSE